MTERFQDVTDAELAVLRVLWDQGRSTIRRIAEILYPRGRPADYATVQKLLERLEAKGCVSRDRSETAHVFSASIERDELIGLRLQAMADKICEGSLTPLLTHLVRSEQPPLSSDQRAALLAILEQADETKASRSKKSHLKR